MCGIAGIIGHDPEKQARMMRMLTAQQHRGPDATAFHDLGDTGILGHNRLSIIDLDVSANQPFCSEDGRFCLVFNGEIYNYLELKEELRSVFIFKTQSDTEVLLAAFIQWGDKCLERLIGMFSFAIWDAQQQVLFAARDRFGVKPFYFAKLTDAFLFASEIKTLWAAGIPRHPREEVWAGYFTHGTYGQPTETFWNDIQQLPGGYALTYKNGAMKTWQWYDFVEKVKEAAFFENEAAIAAKWLSLTRESIRLRFRADVAVGFNLSGGLDSSLLLGLVQEQFKNNPSIQSFTFFTGDERYDELYWAQQMVAHTVFPHSPVQLWVEEIPSLAAIIAIAQDEPYGGIPTLAYSKIFEAARQKNVTVLLDGQGLDEAWAGYDYYRQKTDLLIQGVSGSSGHTNWLQADFKALAKNIAFPQPFADSLQNLQYRDLFYTKLPRALRFNDRISMLHGTELREPFLDHRLVEMAFALPPHLKIQDGQQKWLLRKMAEKFLPSSLSLAPKRPLQTPQREWLANDLRTWTSERIEALTSLNMPWFRSDALREAYTDFTKTSPDNSFFVWQWINSSLLLP